MSATGTGSLPNVAEEFVGTSEERDQCANRLRKIVNDIEDLRFAPLGLGAITGFLLSIVLFLIVGPFLHDILANVSIDAAVLIGACTPLLMIMVSTIGFKVSVYDERRDYKIEELGSLMSLTDHCYRTALEALKESDPPLAEKIAKYTKWHQAKESSR
ncbi:MAG: hypothetical protein ACYC44_03100 [Patescibacteria group bacterium]